MAQPTTRAVSLNSALYAEKARSYVRRAEAYQREGKYVHADFMYYWAIEAYERAGNDHPEMARVLQQHAELQKTAEESSVRRIGSRATLKNPRSFRRSTNRESRSR